MNQDRILQELAAASQGSANQNRVPDGMVVGTGQLVPPPQTVHIDERRAQIGAVLDRHLMGQIDGQIRSMLVEDLLQC